MQQERRRSPRFGVSTSIVARESTDCALGPSVGATIVDFNVNGFAFESGVRFEPGTRLLIERLTVRGPTLQEAIVRHVRRDGEASGHDGAHEGGDVWLHGSAWDGPEELAM